MKTKIPNSSQVISPKPEGKEFLVARVSAEDLGHKKIDRPGLPRLTARFTLIERLPSKGSGYILTESVNPANFPIQAGSPISAAVRVTGVQAGWQSRETGNSPGMADYGLCLRHSLETGSQHFTGRLQLGERGTLSQSERQDKRAGCRQTNIRKHRKACHGEYCWQSHGDSRGEPLFDGRSLPVAGKQLGIRTSGIDGVKGGCTRGMIHMLKSGESLSGSADSVDKGWYKPSGESHFNAWQDVGDGRSTVDRRDSITLREERAISLDVPSKDEDACVTAQKAISTPKKGLGYSGDGYTHRPRRNPVEISIWRASEC